MRFWAIMFHTLLAGFAGTVAILAYLDGATVAAAINVGSLIVNLVFASFWIINESW